MEKPLEIQSTLSSSGGVFVFTATLTIRRRDSVDTVIEMLRIMQPLLPTGLPVDPMAIIVEEK